MKIIPLQCYDRAPHKEIPNYFPKKHEEENQAQSNITLLFGAGKPKPTKTSPINVDKAIKKAILLNNPPKKK